VFKRRMESFCQYLSAERNYSDGTKTNYQSDRQLTGSRTINGRLGQPAPPAGPGGRTGLRDTR